MAFKMIGGAAKGHSNMDHWEVTAAIKAYARSARRSEAKRLVRKAKRGEEI